METFVAGAKSMRKRLQTRLQTKVKLQAHPGAGLTVFLARRETKQDETFVSSKTV
jgi:hypothetical protein